jgi:predicted kinase
MKTKKVKQNRKLIIFIGKTHSGKTTLAKELENIDIDIINIEADPISLFIRDNFPRIRDLENINTIDRYKEVSLKYSIFLELLEFVMAFGNPIVLSNSNMYQRGRMLIYKLAKKFNYDIIGVYFDLPEEILLERINKSNRTTKILRVSKNFTDLIINQRNRIEIPKSRDYKKFYIIKTEEDRRRIKKLLIKFLK